MFFLREKKIWWEKNDIYIYIYIYIYYDRKKCVFGREKRFFEWEKNQNREREINKDSGRI